MSMNLSAQYVSLRNILESRAINLTSRIPKRNGWKLDSLVLKKLKKMKLNVYLHLLFSFIREYYQMTLRETIWYQISL
jgi:hypothetical protein